ncbi:hypothetical protein ACEN8I_22645 [Polaromonas sp. CT11-55]|uniref:hypothetical protein n=1 Tax=Polaromonas sp. CT11-55 TaxID=3243045 RepID=UPI0039A747A2
MAYILEKISPEDRKKIFADVDEDKQKRLQMRGGHFNNEPDLPWAIDRDRNFYLLRAPTFEARSPYRYFFMHYEGKTYGFRVLDLTDPRVLFEDLVPLELQPALQQEIKAAFTVHKWRGMEFTPVFDGEGDK